MIIVTLTGEQRIKEAFAKLNDAAQHGVIKKTAQDVFDYAEKQADTHTKTGALARSTYIRSIGGGFEVGHDERMAPHAKFVHWGTKQHVIKPKEKKALRFVVGSKFVFAKSVNHPGYIGHPWLKYAAERIAPQSFEHHLQQAINSL